MGVKLLPPCLAHCRWSIYDDHYFDDAYLVIIISSFKHVTQAWNLQHRQMWFAQGHKARKWQRQDLNPGPCDSEAVAPASPHHLIWVHIEETKAVGKQQSQQRKLQGLSDKKRGKGTKKIVSRWREILGVGGKVLCDQEGDVCKSETRHMGKRTNIFVYCTEKKRKWRISDSDNSFFVDFFFLLPQWQSNYKHVQHFNTLYNSTN